MSIKNVQDLIDWQSYYIDGGDLPDDVIQQLFLIASDHFKAYPVISNITDSPGDQAVS